MHDATLHDVKKFLFISATRLWQQLIVAQLEGKSAPALPPLSGRQDHPFRELPFRHSIITCIQCRDIILEMAEEKKDQRQSSVTAAESRQTNEGDGEEQPNSLAQDVVEKLAISTSTAADGDGDHHEEVAEPPSPPPPPHHRRHPQSTIVCDAWYGLPTQKRPLRERVNAVARQLRNFEQSALLPSSRRTSQPSEQSRGIRVVLVGKESDVNVIGERLEKLRKEAKEELLACKVELWPNISVEEACRNVNNNTALDCGSEANRPIYLSPDAEITLNPRKSPPRTVIVGMLIDRRVQPNRSNERAEMIEITAARLPMDELNVEGLETNEALNVDTVLEMIVCWWDKVDGLAAACDTTDNNKQKKEAEKEEEMLRRCFVNAASAAMVSHEDRHPNRAIHGSGI